MEGKFLQNNWNEMRGKISEWWDDLTDEDLDSIDGNQEQLIRVLQNRYGYTRNLAFLEVKIRMASYHPEYEEREAHFNKDIRTLPYSRYDNDDGFELKSSRRSLSRSGTKVRAQDFADQ